MELRRWSIRVPQHHHVHHFRWVQRVIQFYWYGRLFSSPNIMFFAHLHALSYIGTSISVYGTITHTGLGAQPISNYTIDSGVPYQFAAPQLQGEDQHQQLFFRATGLALGGPPHTLVITNVADNDYLYLDYFQVLVEPGGPNPGPTSSTSSSSLTATATQSATTTALQTPSESTTTRVGPPILGATIGGTIAALLVACFFFVRRRRNRKRNSPLPDALSSPQLHMSHAPAGSSGGITPFLIGDPSGSFAGLATRGLSASEEGVVRPLNIHVPGATSAGGREKGRDHCDLDLPPGYVQ